MAPAFELRDNVVPDALAATKAESRMQLSPLAAILYVLVFFVLFATVMWLYPIWSPNARLASRAAGRINISQLAAMASCIIFAISAVALVRNHPFDKTQSFHEYVTSVLSMRNVALAFFMHIMCIIGNIHFSGIYSGGFYYNDYLTNWLAESQHIKLEEAASMIFRIAALFTVGLSVLAMYSIITSN
jgi:hypothetical protein